MNLKLVAKYLKTIIIYIFPAYLVFFGVSWILLHFYIRFLLKRSSYTLEELKPYLTEQHYFFFIAFILFNLFYVGSSIIILYKKKYPTKKSSLYVRFLEKVSDVVNIVYWKPLDYIHDSIAPYIPLSGQLFIYIEKIWSRKESKYFYTLIIIFEILPKIIISIVFFVEIIFFGQLKVFLYAISIITITILWQIFLKLFSSFGSRNLPVIKEYFSEITGEGDPIFDDNGHITSYKSFRFVVKEEYEDVIDPKEEADLLLRLEGMPRFVEQIKKDTNKIMPYITLLTSLIYVIGGIYRLIYFIM